MNKKNMLIGAGVLVALYLVLKGKKSANLVDIAMSDGKEDSALSDDEKNSLFLATLGYRGGARPTQSVIDDAREKSKNAQVKIEALGLTAEFKVWKEKQKGNAKIPMTPPTMNSRVGVFL